MVYFNGVYSALEALYLNENLNEVLIESTIVVNPINYYYLSGKTVILNKPDIDTDIINGLLRNSSINIISRIKIPGYDSRIKVIPYLEKPLFNILWNGRIIDSLNEIDDSGIEINWPNIYFPKIKNPGKVLFDKNPSSLGYLLYQVGQDNLINNELFNNLDIIKCKKGNL